MKKYIVPHFDMMHIEPCIICASVKEKEEYTSEELERILIGWDEY